MHGDAWSEMRFAAAQQIRVRSTSNRSSKVTMFMQSVFSITFRQEARMLSRFVMVTYDNLITSCCLSPGDITSYAVNRDEVNGDGQNIMLNCAKSYANWYMRFDDVHGQSNIVAPFFGPLCT